MYEYERLDRGGRRRAAVAVLAVFLLVVGFERPSSQTTASATSGLTGIFAAGGALQDTNGDRAVDFVAAQIVVAPDAPAADVAAAANIAARFGFETMAMDLPVAARAGEPASAGTRLVVLVGSGNPAVTRLAQAGAVDLAALKPGQGVVAYIGAADSGVGADALVVAGADEAGTIAGSEALAARVPYLWALGGPTFKELEDDLQAFLAKSDAAPDSVLVTSATVERNRHEWLSVTVRAAFSTATRAAAARTALQDLAAAHVAGREGQALSYPGVGTVDVRLAAPGIAGSRVRVVRVGAGVETPLPRRTGAGGGRSADLSNLYATGGLLGDSQNDLIPDRTDTVIIPAGAEEALGAIDLAARLGLESTGIRVPLAKAPADVQDPAGESNPILIGRTNPLVQRLVDDKKLDAGELQPGQGLLRIVPRAFGSSGALVVTGGDARGVARATSQLAERLPYVWERGKARTTLDAIEDDARRLISGRSPEGQAAHALYQLSRLAREVRGKRLESARFGVYVEKAPAGFADFVKSEIGRTFSADKVDVDVANIDIHSQVPVFTDEFDVASEADDLRAIVRAKVLAAVAPPPRGRRSRAPAPPVVIEARLSEPPEVRRALEQEIREELAAAGVSDARVSILSAYKQGLSWLTEAVGPALKEKGARSITIRFAELGPPKDATLPSVVPEGSARWQAMYSPIRWLLEAYPADELLARDLGLPLDAIVFEKAPTDAAAYEVSAREGSGQEIYRATFEPTFVYRSYFDQFPNYEVVRVTTGWINAKVGDRQVANERIVTDIEKFWDHYQQKTLPRIYAYTMDLFEGKPDPAAAPYFAELNVDLTLSEPDFRLGVDEEQVASLEAMHEEVYFTTLHFFDVFGRYTKGQPLNYPGRIIPVMRPKGDGKPGHATITFTGKAADRPKVTLEYREQGRAPVRRTLRLPQITIERPSAVAAWVRDGRDGIERLELKIEADFAEDTRADLIRKSNDDQVDRTVLFAPQAIGVVDNLRRLHAAGLFRDALVYEHLGEVAFRIVWPGGEKQEAIASTGAPKPYKDLRTLAAGYRYDGKRIVHWDGPIGPPEAYEMLAKMSTFPEVTPYWIGESYLGKDIWAADVMPPMNASHWSQAKATALKPTVIYSARQHANEVSSTSHTMRLVELLLTDPEYTKYLSRVNVVIHPITNPDGAQLAYDLQKITPNYMLHAGYLGALGVDATSGAGQDPLYPEAKVRPLLRRTWLPDAFLNPHGYPSHEWVQIFSEYVSWVRAREPGGRGWCCNRGWYTSINYPSGEQYAKHKDVALALREYIVDGINSDPDVHAMNQRNYARYTRYGYTFDPENFKLHIYKGVNVYMPPTGTRRPEGGQDREEGASDPRITYISSGTEAPDETARGDWMKIVASAGLQWDLAVLKLLYDTEFKIERREEASVEGVSLAVFRPRPGTLPKLTSPTTTLDAEQNAAMPNRNER